MSSENKSTGFASVIKNPGFINLWVNQILVQFAYNCLNFTLIIWVFRLTGSNIAVSTLMFAVYLPAVVFGLLAGVFVDVINRKKVIMTVNILLSLSFFTLVFVRDSYFAVLSLAFFINTLSQLYVPAESSSIPLLVKKHQLLAANSLFSVTLFITFLFGFGLAGPIIEFFGINAAFELIGSISFIAFVLSLFFPNINSKMDEDSKKLISALSNHQLSHIRKLILREIGATLKMVQNRLPVLISICIMAGVQVVIGIMAVLIPDFMERVIHVDATNASYVMVAPLGLGMVLGGFLLGRFGSKISRRLIVGTSICLAGLLFFSAGIAPIISPAVSYFHIYPRPLPFFTQIPLATILGIGSFFLGMCLVAITVPSQTVVQENTPEGDRGKVFAVLAVAMSAFSLLPVLLVGVIADLLGTMPIFIGIGGLIFLVGLVDLKPNWFLDKDNISRKLYTVLGRGHWD